MKFSFPYKRLLILSLIGGLVTGPLLTSCGSGDGQVAGIGGTGITQGEITAFGSIFVNGVEFDTDSSLFEVDGDTSLDQTALAVGMIVTITGDTNIDGVTGIASSVEYDDDIQGPVSSVALSGEGQRTLTIFGQSVVIDEVSTSYRDTTFNDITLNDIVEVSGFKTSPTQIKATFVKKTGVFSIGAEVELKGIVTNLSDSSFEIAGITINYNHNGTLEPGLSVEVKGELQSPTTILALEVELEEEGFEDNTEISLQGVISEFNSNASFKVAGQPVDASGIPSLAITLENGLNVETEGKIVNGVLIATEVELREGSVEIKAAVENIIGNQIEFQFLPTSESIFVVTNNQTQFEDETTTLPNFSLSNIQANNFVKIEGFEVDGEIIASQVKRLDPTNEDTEIQGRVSAYTASASITILGLTFNLDGTTEEYEPLNLADTIEIGDVIELVDNNPADGIIDKVESE